jgi:hypothetical protein
MTARLAICLFTAGFFATAWSSATAFTAEPAPQTKTTPQAKVTARPKQQVFSGKVVLLQEALKRRGIKAFNEMKGQVALETTTGELIPIISDWRGRAFFQDKRLRDRKVDLVGYRRPGLPYLQVLMVFTYDKKGVRQYTDYWCDICSIPMYEAKPCDCCQDDTRLRFQPRGLPDYLNGNSSNSALPKLRTKPDKRLR